MGRPKSEWWGQVLDVDRESGGRASFQKVTSKKEAQFSWLPRVTKRAVIKKHLNIPKRSLNTDNQERIDKEMAKG
jgi:hypothetical protein